MEVGDFEWCFECLIEGGPRIGGGWDRVEGGGEGFVVGGGGLLSGEGVLIWRFLWLAGSCGCGDVTLCNSFDDSPLGGAVFCVSFSSHEYC